MEDTVCSPGPVGYTQDERRVLARRLPLSPSPLVGEGARKPHQNDTTIMTDNRASLLVPVLLAAAAAGAEPPRGYDHWAWKRPARPDVPAVRDPSWVRTPVDA